MYKGNTGIYLSIGNNAWGLGISQSFCKYCRFFLCKFSDINCVDTPNSHATNAEYLQD